MKASTESIAARRESFLKTLKGISAQRGGSDDSRQAVRLESSTDDHADIVSTPTETRNNTTQPNKEASESDLCPLGGADQKAISTVLAFSPSVLLSLASTAGMRSMQSGQGLMPGSADGRFPTDKDSIAVTDSAALTELITRLEQNGPMPSPRIAAWLNRFSQHLAGTVPMQGTASSRDLTGEGNPTNPLPEPAVTESLQNGACPADADAKADIFGRMGDGRNGQQTSPVTLRSLQRADSFSTAVPKAESLPPDRNVGQALYSENRGEFYFGKPAQTMPAGNTDVSVVQEASTAKQPSDSLEKPNLLVHPNDPNRLASSPETGQQHSGADPQDRFQKKDTVQQSINKEFTAAHKNTIQPLPGEEPVSKLITDAQIIRGTDIKLASVSGEEVAGRGIRVDGGQPDSGLPASQNQITARLLETVSSPKEAEAGHGSLREQTMDQIVKKAMIHLRNGQNEAKIHLKPEFLGHIRMQVATENHQVSIKILAEHAFVKEMLENNIQQLKSELQQQGLAVERLEVSVSRDSAGFDQARENTQRLKAKHRRGQTERTVHPTDEVSEAPRHVAPMTEGVLTVDYFA